MARWTDCKHLDAVIVSHLHIDHFGDLYPLFYALRFDYSMPWGLPLYQPGGLLELMGRILSDDAREFLPRVFDERRIGEDEELVLGEMRFSFFPITHMVEGYSIRVEGRGWSLAYSADTSLNQDLVKAALGVDLFICEATMPVAFEKEASFGHLTSHQAARVAQEAGVRHLVLTHIWPTFEPEMVASEAAEVFGGRISVARENQRIEL